MEPLALIGVAALIIVILILVGAVHYSIHLERKYFNNGTCRVCGRRLRLFDYDSQGGRGYMCKNCGYVVWVDHSCVDGDFLLERKAEKARKNFDKENDDV